MTRSMNFCALALAVVMAGGAQVQASLIGNTISVSGSGYPPIQPATAVVGDGIEFIGGDGYCPPHGLPCNVWGYNVDFGANDVVLSTFGNLLFAFDNLSWTFTNTSNPFPSSSFLDANPPLNVNLRVWCSSGQLNITIPNGAGFPIGQSIRYAIPAVPEPLSIVPFGLAGLSLVGVARRRLRSRASTRFWAALKTPPPARA
jgi:hypothetical protein